MLKNEISLFPFPNNKKERVTYFLDKQCGLPYVIVGGKRLYFPKNFSKQDVISNAENLILEQKEGCPHRYIEDSTVLTNDMVIVDAGCAEANFTLKNIDKVQKAVLIEADSNWAEALKKTFEPWADKVKIIYTYVSDVTDECNMTIDDILKEEKCEKVFLKMDLEGYGLKALHGAKNTLSNKKCYVASACYHTQEECKTFYDFFQTYFPDYSLETSEGYIFPYFFHDFHYPYFRKVMFRAHN